MRTYNLHLSKNFPAGPTVKDALKVLQDPQESIRLSPVISSVEPDPTRGDGHFIVTEKVPIIGSIYYPTKYKTNWRSMLDGCEWEVEASFGTKIRSRSKVKEENGVVVFTEDLDAETPAPLMPLLKRTLKDAHTKLQDRLVEKVLANSA